MVRTPAGNTAYKFYKFALACSFASVSFHNQRFVINVSKQNGGKKISEGASNGRLVIPKKWSLNIPIGWVWSVGVVLIFVVELLFCCSLQINISMWLIDWNDFIHVSSYGRLF